MLFIDEKKPLSSLTRKSLLYQTGVEYGDWTINHAQGCSHGCQYPCYAMQMAIRFGKVKNYEEWIKPRLVENAEELLLKEIPKYRNKIRWVHFSFTTDPFMYQNIEIQKLSLRLIQILNQKGIRCSVLTKGILPLELASLSPMNEVGVSLVSLSEDFRKKYEPYSAPVEERLSSLKKIAQKGIFTWVSMEPYPTPNIVDQNFTQLLKAVSFVDKIIFGRWNYNALVSKYPGQKEFYHQLSQQTREFCVLNKKQCHIKEGTEIS